MGETSFFQKRSICRRRDDTRFFECAFGVDETLVGKYSFLERCVLRRRDVILQNAFAIVAQKSQSSMAPDGAIRFPKYVFGVGEMQLGVDETIFDF